MNRNQVLVIIWTSAMHWYFITLKKSGNFRDVLHVDAQNLSQIVVNLVVNSFPRRPRGLHLIGRYAAKCDKWICRGRSLQAATWVRAKAADHQCVRRRTDPDVAARVGRTLPCQ